jgi:hypothetical protein
MGYIRLGDAQGNWTAYMLSREKDEQGSISSGESGVDGHPVLIGAFPKVQKRSVSTSADNRMTANRESLPDDHEMLQSAFDCLVRKYRRPLVGFMYFPHTQIQQWRRNWPRRSSFAPTARVKDYEARAKFTTRLYVIAKNLRLHSPRRR